jgi:23S rRNA (cytosine1962-C5)-methyltransferase
MYPVIKLKKDKEKSILRKHPWVFSGALQQNETSLEDGQLVFIQNFKNETIATGHFYNGSIAAKIIAFEAKTIDQIFWNESIKSAYLLREKINLIGNTSTNAYRLIHGEGDGLPGLIIDIYNDTAIIQAHSIGMHFQIDMICSAIQNCFGKKIKNIYDKSKQTLPDSYAQSQGNRFLLGKKVNLEICENGKIFEIDIQDSQKTGFFIDQRENRALLANYSKDKKILNTFCYTGGFSIYALQNGAKEVHSVDSSAKAIQQLDKNILLNPPYPGIHHSYCEDVHKFLNNTKDEYDIVILDPPAYAKSIHKKHNAVQGYIRLNESGIKKVKPGGILFTFSCSGVIDFPLFQNTIAAAAIASGREVQILHRLGQPADHPVSLFHPEGNYLKGLVLLVK